MRIARFPWCLIPTLCAVGIAIYLVAINGTRTKTGSQPPRDAPNSTSVISLSASETTDLRVDAHWEGIKDSMYGFHLKWAELGKFKPAMSSERYSGSDFKAFLPRNPVAVGEIWHLEEEGLLKFLRQFHPGATLKLHINNGDSLGAYACLRGFSDRYAHIMFRIHAEFVLRDGFFTPGQFTGSLVLDRHDGQVAAFQMYVPPGPINFDVGWWIAGGGIGSMMVNGKKVEFEARHAADAGSLPRMELLGGVTEVTKNVHWIAAQSEDEVNRRMALKFYSFKKIDWIAFEDAVGLAKRSGKPLHVIAVDGTLDDESC